MAIQVVTVVHVISSVTEWMMSIAQIDFRKVEHERRELLDTAWTAPLAAAHIPFRTQLVVAPKDPMGALVEQINKDAPDLVVVGHRVGAHLDGATAKLARRVRQPLLLVPA